MLVYKSRVGTVEEKQKLYLNFFTLPFIRAWELVEEKQKLYLNDIITFGFVSESYVEEKQKLYLNCTSQLFLSLPHHCWRETKVVFK